MIRLDVPLTNVLKEQDVLTDHLTKDVTIMILAPSIDVTKLKVVSIHLWYVTIKILAPKINVLTDNVNSFINAKQEIDAPLLNVIQEKDACKLLKIVMITTNVPKILVTQEKDALIPYFLVMMEILVLLTLAVHTEVALTNQ
jgi:hypothetical protein